MTASESRTVTAHGIFNTIKLVDDAERKLYVNKAVKLFERELLQYLL